jgi:UDP-glucose 4-epimerase
MSKFIVTGGAGFIGSHLVDNLVERGCEIVVIDNLSSGKITNLQRSIDSIEFQHISIEDIDMSQFHDIKAVFHLAAQASVPLSIKNFYQSSSTNVLGALKIIEYCSNNRVPLVYASSSAIYGNRPIGIEGDSVDILSPYALDKYFLESYAKLAHDLYGLKTFGLRFFNVYGPRQDPANPYSGVISIFADRILKGEPITINGGHQTRDFIYVNDIVRGIWNAYQYLLGHSVSTYSNLLTGNSISIDELANILVSLTGNMVLKRYHKLPPGDPEKSLGTIDRMRDQLKIDEFVKLEVGLGQVLAWMRATS